MNKKSLSVILIITAFTMIGCSNKQTNNQLNANTSTQSQQSKDNSNSESANPKIDSINTNNSKDIKETGKKDNLYNVIENTYKIANITIKYPQISNLGDDNKQEKINKLIKDSVIDGYDLTETIKTGVIPSYNEPIENLSLDVSYTIELQDSNILSIKYLGESYMKNSAHPNNELCTTNVDINNVKILRLSDMVTINQALVDALRKGNYVPWSKDFALTQSDINTLIGAYNDRDLQTALEQSDKPNGLENPFYTHSYLTKDGIVISISVNHAAGDHAEFKMSYNSIKNNIKTNNEELNNLLDS